MCSALTLWHVTCGHFPENGCYGCESANNEIASRDSGPRRNHQSAPTAREAWPISHSTSLPCHPHHWCQAKTDNRRRYARPAGYSASRKDYSFAPCFGPGSGYPHNCYRHGNSRCALAQAFHPFVAADLKRHRAAALQDLPDGVTDKPSRQHLWSAAALCRFRSILALNRGQAHGRIGPI
jgi:hypothetical protein